MSEFSTPFGTLSTNYCPQKSSACSAAVDCGELKTTMLYGQGDPTDQYSTDGRTGINDVINSTREKEIITGMELQRVSIRL